MAKAERPPDPEAADENRQSGKSDWQLLKSLWPYVRPYRYWLLTALIATTVTGILGLGFPWILGTLVDSALDPASGDLGRSAVILIAIFAGQAIFTSIRIRTLAYAGQHVVNNVRSALFNRMVRFPIAFLDARTSGALSSRLISDAAFVYGSASGAAPQIVYSGITVLGGAALILIIDPLLALVVLVAVPVAALIASRYGQRMRKLSRGYQNGLATTNALAAESLSGARVVKWFGAEREVARIYHRRLQGVIDQGLQRARLKARWTPTMMFLASVTIVAVLWFGGSQVQSGTLTAGELVSFLLYARFVADGLATIVDQYSRLAQGLGASERVVALLDEPTEELVGGNTADRDTIEPLERRGEVTVRDVSFSYPGRDSLVLRNVSFDIHPGSSVALVGPSGAGKSTIAQLIARLYDPQEGVISVDGVDVRDQNLSSLRKSMGVVPQDAPLLSGTVADNIRLGQPDATREQVAEAAQAANAFDFITEFPYGFGTKVGERGLALSGGQRQRIAIARALLADPKLLVLDEATNALDSESETLVQQALQRLMAGRTNLIIAHRLSTVLSADHVMVIDEGTIVESGSPQDLLAGDTRFAAMAAAQSLGLDQASPN